MECIRSGGPLALRQPEVPGAADRPPSTMNYMCAGVVQSSELPPLQPTPSNQRTKANDTARGQRDEGLDAAAAGLLGAGCVVFGVHHPNHNIKQSPCTKIISLYADFKALFCRI